MKLLLEFYSAMGFLAFVLLQFNNGWRWDYEEFCARFGMALLWPVSLGRELVLWYIQRRWERQQEARRQERLRKDEELH